jgi:mono/diheme cytochrome c family protein
VFGIFALLTSIALHEIHGRVAPVPDLKIAGTPAQILRGQAIASSLCGACHSPTGTLTGGRDLGKDLAVRIGHFTTSNLTPAGELRHWSDGQMFRAIRNSVDDTGRRLLIMSLTNVGRLSDEDIRAVIAYIRSLPAAGMPTPTPPDELNPLGIVLVALGQLPESHPISVDPIIAPPKGPTIEYGAYVLSYQDCRTCHGQSLGGGDPHGVGIVGPGLEMVQSWTPDQFMKTLRTGVDPAGHRLDGNRMPWQTLGKMDDDELEAVYQFVSRTARPDEP